MLPQIWKEVPEELTQTIFSAISYYRHCKKSSVARNIARESAVLARSATTFSAIICVDYQYFGTIFVAEKH
jgi:hypothetical protein